MFPEVWVGLWATFDLLFAPWQHVVALRPRSKSELKGRQDGVSELNNKPV